VVTGTRADYGPLHGIIKEIEEDEQLELQLITTGMHLSPEFGFTYQEIEKDGFLIAEQVEMLLSSDTPVGIAKSVGLGVIGFADVFARLQPDLLVLLGDRFEMLAAAQAAMIAQIPIAHIGGGDTTEGAFDEVFRHSITKMAHLHFVFHENAAKRVKQMGENPEHIYIVGNPAIDQIKQFPLMAKEELEQSLPYKFRKINLLITFHSVTLDQERPKKQFQELLFALDELNQEFDLGLIFTKGNADTYGRVINQMIDDYIATHPKAKGFFSLGQLRYFSLVQQIDVVVGNSSSGLLEVPTFKKPTVNIGDRQKGRLRSTSVIDCGAEKKEIITAIKKAFSLDCDQVVNPYGDGNSSKRIMKILKERLSYGNSKEQLKKHFFESDEGYE